MREGNSVKEKPAGSRQLGAEADVRAGHSGKRARAENKPRGERISI